MSDIKTMSDIKIMSGVKTIVTKSPCIQDTMFHTTLSIQLDINRRPMG
ncbi:MAG: hypothetical protein QG613_746 [Pseudomonadota bacterium]|nr:hypothetical protein [Pseudomonadota bacterium]